MVLYTDCDSIKNYDRFDNFDVLIMRKDKL